MGGDLTSVVGVRVEWSPGFEADCFAQGGLSEAGAEAWGVRREDGNAAEVVYKK